MEHPRKPDADASRQCPQQYTVGACGDKQRCTDRHDDFVLDHVEREPALRKLVKWRDERESCHQPAREVAGRPAPRAKPQAYPANPIESQGEDERCNNPRIEEVTRNLTHMSVARTHSRGI